MPQHPFVDEPLSDAQVAAFEDTPLEDSPPQRSWTEALMDPEVSVPAALAHTGIGVAKGAGRTAVSLGRLVHKIPGVSSVLGDYPADAETQLGLDPTNTAQRIGMFGEQAGEFLVPLSKASTALKGRGMLMRILGEGGAGAATAGAQSSGDPGAMMLGAAGGAVGPPIGRGAAKVGSALRTAAQTAEDTGIGGAVASLVRKVVPVESKQLFMQGVKPRSSQVRFEPALDRALPELKATEQELGRPIASVDDLLEATALAKKRVRAQYDQMAGPLRAMGSTVDLTPVADDMVASIPSKVKIERPAEAARIADTAANYRRPFKLEEAEQLLKETNAELESFYGKFPGGQRKALEASPEAAGLHAQAEALRKTIYGHLDSGTGAAGELQRRYGSLMAVEEEAFRRMNVAKRLQPESLAEQVSGARGLGDMARGAYKISQGNITGAADIAGGYAMREAAKFMKEQQTTNALIRRAFQGFDQLPSPVTMPPVRPVRGLLGRAPLITPPPADTSGLVEPPAFMSRSYPVSERRGLPPARTVHEAGPAPDTSGPTEPPAFMSRQYPLTARTIRNLSNSDLAAELSGLQQRSGDLGPEEIAQRLELLRQEIHRRGIGLVPIKGGTAPLTYTQRR